MKLLRFLVFTFLAFPLIICGQDVQFQWVKTIGTGFPDYSLAVGTDANGNVYSMGTFQGTVDMDSGPGVFNMTALGTLDIFIVKYDATGNFLWARQIGNNYSGNEGPRNMTVDPAGNLYITGFFYHTLDFNPGPAVDNLTCAGSGYAAFLLKLDANGNYAWARNIAQSDYGNTGYSIDVAPSGNIYVLGTFKGLTDFDPGPAASNVNSLNPAQDIFISKFDNGGNFIWSKQFSGTQGQVGYSIKVDVQENVYCTGLFSGTSDFDPGPAVFNLVASNIPAGTWVDAFVSKLDANGNFIWAKQFEGAYDEQGFGLTLDPSGDIIITGEFEGDTDFDPGPGTFIMQTTRGEISGFIVKLNANGQLVWARQVGGAGGSVQPRSITCDAAGDIYVTGSFGRTVDFDPGNGVYNLSSPSQSSAVFVCKLKADGSFGFAKQVGADKYSHAYCIVTDQANNIYLSGYFADICDFDPEPGEHIISAKGSVDGFVLKLSQCLSPTSETINVTACTAYTLNSQTYTTGGTFTQRLVNKAGCDSTLTIKLTIGGSVTTTLDTTVCESYDWEGETYTSSGNYSVIFTDSHGCDSIRQLKLTIHNKISTVFNLFLCEGQSYQGYNSSGSYTDVFTGANGCDSIRTLHLTIKPLSREVFNVSICEGDSYWGHDASGTYTDTLLAANVCDSIRVLNLQVNPVIRTNLVVSICKGESYFAGGLDQNSSGIYIDTLKTYLDCDSLIITSLTVHELPAPNLGADRDICKGSSILFNPGSFANYLWQDQSTAAALTISEPGTYWVKVKDSWGCTATDSVVIANFLPKPEGFLKPMDTICQYEKLRLIPVGNYDNYSWSDGSHSSTITIDRPGQYILEVQDNNGCYGSDTTYVYSSICKSGLFIPNAFTPNSDGMNDMFRVIAYGNLVTFNLVVYNRWGELVFLTNDPSKGWDGKTKGAENNTTVFVWKCKYQLQGDEIKEEKGTVTLIR